MRPEEDRFRVTLQSIGDAVIVTDAGGRVESMNPVAETLTGWTQGDALGRHLDEIFHIVEEGARTQVECPAIRAMRDGVVVGLANHTILLSRDGTERAIDDSAAPIRDSDGAVSGAVLVFRDVAEQRRAARLLAESEARKTAILATALDCIITIDHEGKVVDFNPAAERTFGRLREEVLGREMAELIVPPALRDAHRRGMAHYLATGEGPVLNRRVEITAMRADGTEFPVELAITPIEGGGSLLFTGHLRDISDRKRAERDSAEQIAHATLAAEVGIALTGTGTLKDMLQTCAESMVRNLEGAFARIWTLNERDGNLELRASAGLYTHLDGPHSRVPLGMFKIGRIAQDRLPHLTNSVIGDPQVAEQEWAKREGLVAFVGYPLIINDRMVGVMAMFARQSLSELTISALASVARAIALGIEQKEMSNRMRLLVAALSEGDRRKDEFLAMLAHELRNPLAPLRNGLQVMRLAGTSQEAIEETRSMMERQLTQLVRLVDDLMDINRISRGRIELRRERVPLAEVLNSAIETSRPMIEEMDHELTVVLPEDSIIVDGDAARLAQLFMNLLNNAAKYTDRGGRIALIAECEQSEVTVTIRDTGIGLAPEQLTTIFEMFSQVDRSLEKAQGGLGIGLTLVKRLVEMHGGTVAVASAGLGKGSQFVVKLPIDRRLSAGDSAPQLEEPETPPPSHRIVVVDDNKDGADSIALMLRILGNEVRTAYDGLEGVEVAKTFQPDVVLLDIGLPGLNGYETCRIIRQSAWGKRALMIAITGWGQDEDRRRSREAGFDHHLVKPVDPVKLLKLLAPFRAGGPGKGADE